MYDLLIKNVKLVRPNQTSMNVMDVAIQNGKFVKIAASIDASDAKEIHDGKGLLAFPGLVDGHMHVGIYSPLAEDAITESKAAAMGGVTSALTYFRTGEYYLNKGGSYKDFYPEVLKLSPIRISSNSAFGSQTLAMATICMPGAACSMPAIVSMAFSTLSTPRKTTWGAWARNVRTKSIAVGYLSVVRTTPTLPISASKS